MNIYEIEEKYFIEGTDCSAEECLTNAGYCSLWKQKDSDQQLLVASYQQDNEFYVQTYFWDGESIERPHWLATILTMPIDYMKRFFSFADITSEEQFRGTPTLSLLQSLVLWDSSYIFGDSQPQIFHSLEEVLSSITGEEVSPEEEQG